MDPEDLPSDSDESDDDYCPVKENDSGSEEIGSDYDDVEENAENGTDGGKNGRKRKKKTKNSSAKTAKITDKQQPNDLNKETENEDNDDVDKSKIDALWADFLGGTDDPYSSSKKENTNIPKNNSKNEKSSLEPSRISGEREKIPDSKTVKQIFEFAGEKVEISQEVNAEDDKTPSASSSKPGIKTVAGIKRGGMSSILDQIGKKNKISTLEKTKLDWEGFKKKEGIHEELQTHNKGKNGYLERKDFLERTDLRQFEIEKGLRQSKRSGR